MCCDRLLEHAPVAIFPLENRTRGHAGGKRFSGFSSSVVCRRSDAAIFRELILQKRDGTGDNKNSTARCGLKNGTCARGVGNGRDFGSVIVLLQPLTVILVTMDPLKRFNKAAALRRKSINARF
jgi:hypothetical protein